MLKEKKWKDSLISKQETDEGRPEPRPAEGTHLKFEKHLLFVFDFVLLLR